MNIFTLPCGPSNDSQKSAQKLERLSLILTTLVFLLSGMPKLRIVIGAPIYAVDLIIFYLLIKTPKTQSLNYGGTARLITQLASGYIVLMVLGELYGGWVYGRYFDSIYMLFRCYLAASIIRIVPRQVKNLEVLKLLLKGLCIGLFISAVISILYSFPSTRWLTDYIFSVKMLAPDGEQVLAGNNVYDAAYGGGYRGRNLIGTSTFTSGVMALLWPLVFMSKKLFRSDVFWNRLSIVTLCVAPLAILATYGRTAWLSVIFVLLSILILGSDRGKLHILLGILVASLLFGQVGLDSITAKLPLVNRIVTKTQIVAASGAENESEAERFHAYVEPFEHVLRHPSFFFVGTGVAQRKFDGNALEEATTASHAIPAMAYYAYGVGGAFCQIGFMLCSFKLIYCRLRQARKKLPCLAWMWQSLLAAWCGLFPWWCFAHGLVSQPRGAMVFFLYLGILLSCEHIYRQMDWLYSRHLSNS